MLKLRTLVKINTAAIACALLAGGTLFSGCNISDIRDSLIAGSLSAIQGAASDAVGSVLVDFNEFIDAIPDAPLIDTP